jgi:mannose-6-phosphate isomerase
MAEPAAARPLGPWSLPPNRVSRFYRGGALLDRLRGVPESDARDGDCPEDWLASVVPAWAPPGGPRTDDGLSRVDPGGGEVLLRDLLERDPAAIAGEAMVRRAGPTTGLLVKLLDAAVRLPVHCHPSRAFARRHLGSFFGKAEAWIILEVREIPGAEPPNVRLGFRRDVDLEELRQLVETGDTDALLAVMHARPARPGDTWFVPPGLPHAIGAGVMIAEVQEPSDFSILAETRDVPVDRAAITVGLPMEIALEAFDRRGWADGAIDGLRQPVPPEEPGDGFDRRRLLGSTPAPYFRAERLTVSGTARPWTEEAFVVAIVEAGRGAVRVDDAVLAIGPGSVFAVPAAGAPRAELAPAGGERLRVLVALPPRPEDLDGGAVG